MMTYDDFRKDFVIEAAKATKPKDLEYFVIREKDHVPGRTIYTTCLSKDAAEWVIRQIYEGKHRNAQYSERSLA